MKKEPRRLRIGVLGCGPIAQFAHLDAIRKARNADLYALCDVDQDLLARMNAVHAAEVCYSNLDAMLADDQVEAVVIAVADQFHVPLCRRALAAGKHVLVEKPLGTSVEECDLLVRDVESSGRVVQVGNNRRFDPGIAFVHKFIQEEIGQLTALKAWYYDSAWRYTMTDNLQPIPVAGKSVLRPGGNPKADKRRYFLLTHGAHLVDTARHLGGEIESLQARLLERSGAYCWFVALTYGDGSLGHLDLTIAVQGDFEEGFQLHGENGSARGHVYLPWFHKSSLVECFSSKDRQFRRPLGEDAYTYKLQIEAFADCILHGHPQQGASAQDGASAVRAMVAIARSVENSQPVRLAEVTGAV